MCSGSEQGSYLRRIDFCITPLTSTSGALTACPCRRWRLRWRSPSRRTRRPNIPVYDKNPHLSPSILVYEENSSYIILVDEETPSHIAQYTSIYEDNSSDITKYTTQISHPSCRRWPPRWRSPPRPATRWPTPTCAPRPSTLSTSTYSIDGRFLKV